MNDDGLSALFGVAIFGFIAYHVGKFVISAILAFVAFIIPWVLLGIAVVGSVYALFAFHAATLESQRRAQLAHQQQQQLLLDQEAAAEEQARFEANQVAALEHYQKIEAEDVARREALLTPMLSHGRPRIGFSKPDHIGARYIEITWQGLGNPQFELHIYRNTGAVYRTEKEVREHVGVDGRVGVHRMVKNGRFIDWEVGPCETYNYYAFWTYRYVGEQPAIIVDGRVKTEFTREDLRRSIELTTKDYSVVVRGGFVVRRRTIPPIIDPLDIEERELDREERKQALQKRREALGLAYRAPTSPDDAVDQAALIAMATAQKEMALELAAERAMAKIDANPDLNDEAKETARMILREQLEQFGELS